MNDGYDNVVNRINQINERIREIQNLGRKALYGRVNSASEQTSGGDTTKEEAFSAALEQALLEQALESDDVLNSGMNSGMKPVWKEVIQCAARDLAVGGRIAVVDFHDTMVGPFRRWMGVNHVKMEGHLLPELKNCFAPVLDEKHFAYGGLWRYMLFIGKKSLYHPDNGLRCAGHTVNPPVLQEDSVRFTEPVVGVPQSF